MAVTSSVVLSERDMAARQASPTGGEDVERKSYAQILRSSALIGGSSAVTMAIGVLRAKAMAVMLGPAGFGLMGVFTTIADLARTLAQLGINNSGVRQIAEATGSGDVHRIAVTVTVLRRVAVVLGIIGALLLIVLARPVAVLTFGDDQHALSVALLSLAVLLRLVADGQGALLQGMRRIGDIAKIGIIGALAGAIASVALVYWLRENGVAASLVVAAGASLVISWWYSRKVKIDRPALTISEVTAETRLMLRLGLAFMFSALLTMGAAYLVRLILIRSAGLEAAGLYQAAWTVGGMYVAFILQAMGTDFYPRLVASAHDNEQCNRLVNEQAQVSLLLAGAGVLATLTFASWVVRALYSTDFGGAADVLRWVCLGMALRVVTWPLGYILVAKGAQILFVAADLLWTTVNVGLTWWCVQRFGMVGAGMAFFGSYVFHLAVVYPMCRRLSGFRWSSTNVKISLSFAALIAAVQAGFLLLEAPLATGLGAAAFLLSAIASVRMLHRLVGTEQLPKKLSRLIRPGNGAP
jgi:enterobacterial common antigen flippase